MQIEGISKRTRTYFICSVKSEEATAVNMKWMWGWKPFSNTAEHIIYFINPQRQAHNRICD